MKLYYEGPVELREGTLYCTGCDTPQDMTQFPNDTWMHVLCPTCSLRYVVYWSREWEPDILLAVENGDWSSSDE